jgi:hypothetical protein
MTGADGDAEVRPRPDRAILGVVFLLLFGFSYSEEVVIGLFRAIGQGEPEKWRIALIVADLGILVWAGLLKRSISRTDRGGPRLWRWWWTGFAITIALDVAASGLPETPPIWVDVLTSMLYTVAMSVLMMSSLNADPVTLFSSRKRAAMRRDWLRVRSVVPLIVGTLAAYLGATVFADFLDVNVVRTLDPDMAARINAMPLSEQLGVKAQLCTGAVNPGYFPSVVVLLAFMLLSLGVEFNQFRRTMLDPAQRAATAATITVVSAGVMFALSTLPLNGTGCGEVLTHWHEYLAFVVTMQGIVTALATLVWMWVVSSPDAEPDDGIDRRDGSRAGG